MSSASQPPWRATATKSRPPRPPPRPSPPPPPPPPSHSSSAKRRHHGSVSGSGGVHSTAKWGSYGSEKPAKKGLKLAATGTNRFTLVPKAHAPRDSAFSLVRLFGRESTPAVIHVQRDSPPITCGRAAHCDVVLNVKHVSRTHLELHAQRDKEGKPILVLYDVSCNGTWINGQKLSPKCLVRLQTGDVLTFLSPEEEQDNPDSPSFRFFEGQAGRHHGSVSASGGVHSTAEWCSSGGEKPAKKRRIDSGCSSDSETSADDDCPHSSMPSANRLHHGNVSGSGGVHSTAAGSSTDGLEPKKEHSVYSGSSTVSETVTDDGSQHSIAPITILFIDVGDVEDQLKGHILEDERLDPDPNTMEDIEELVQEVRPGIYVKPRLVKCQETEWHIGNQLDWEEVSQEFIPLQNTPYSGFMTTWRRLTPCNSIMNFFFVRIPECHRESIYYVNYNKRADIARNIFLLLDKAKPPFLVIGNLGFALATLIRFLQQFDDDNGLRLEDRLQIICSADQKLMCLFKNKESQIISQKELKGNPECLCIDISWTGSGIKQSTARNDHSDITSVSRREHYLKMMTLSDNCEEILGAQKHFNEILSRDMKLRPVVSSSSKPNYTGVIDVDATLKTLDDSFNLLKQARAQAGVYQSNRTLEKHEFQVAHDWLHKRFRDYFIENEDLNNRVHAAAANDLKGKQKQALLKETRGAFKVWKRSLVGNHEFLMAVLRHGYFDAKTQQDLLQAVLQERSKKNDEDQPSQRERKELKRAAQAARKTLRDARKLEAEDIPDSDLSRSQIQLLRDLDLGVLQANMVKANKAYKHGEGVEIRTREDAAVLRMSCNQLDAYYDR